MPLMVRMPSEPTQDELGFATFHNYVSSISTLIDESAAPRSRLVETIAAGPTFRRIQRNTTPDLALVRRRLRNAWSTEIVLGLPRQLGGGLVRYANHWAPVQAYYAVFLALHAFHAAAGRDPVSDHAAMLSAAAEDLRTGRLSAPTPWAMSCMCRTDKGHAGFAGLPADATLETLSAAMSVPLHERRWSFYGLALRTTRGLFLDDENRVRAWKKRNLTKAKKPRRNITQAGRDELDARLHPTTLFDFLYRLRLRSNYRDADTIVVGSGSEAENFNDCLLTITDATLLMIECHVRQHLGRVAYRKIVDDFLRGHGSPQTDPLSARAALLDAL
jgi:hypothetical protein